MNWLTGHWDHTWMTAAKAVLLYATALAGLRLGTRRTLAQMSLFDFVTAVAIGAVIGRTVTAAGTSYADGAVAVITLIAVHRAVSLLRYFPGVRRVTDHRLRILVHEGRVRTRQLRICGLTRADLDEALRQHGLTRLSDARLVLYERAGGLTIVSSHGTGDLIDSAISAAARPPGSALDQQM